MGTAALPSLNPTANELKSAGRIRSAEALSRRAQQRRQIQGVIGISYIIDAAILLVYAYAGTIPTVIGPAFAISGLVSIAGYILVSESGFT